MLAAMILGLLPVADPGITPRASLVLRELVSLDTPEIGLAQVAVITGPEDMVSVLERVSLGSAPVPGGSRTVAVAYIRLRLKRYGVDPGAVDIQGAAVTVQRTCTVSDRSSTRPPAISEDPVPSLPPDIQRNDEVQVAVQCRGVTVALVGRALQDGGPGDVIRVQIPQTSRTVEATVIGPGRLALQL